MVSYLVPYSGERTYTYTAPINIARINFLLPDQAGISLSGANLFGPDSMTLQDGKSYTVYSYENLEAGQSLNISFKGTVAKSESESKKTNNLLAASAAFLGFGILGAGIWRWRRSGTVKDAEEETEVDDLATEPTLDELIAKIAQLDETYEQLGLSEEEYQNQRRELMQQAKQVL